MNQSGVSKPCTTSRADRGDPVPWSGAVQRIAWPWIAVPIVQMALVGSCATASENAARKGLDTAAAVGPRHDEAPRAEVRFDGAFAPYAQYAMQHNADLEASYERWRAKVLMISKSRRLPEPTLSFGVFVRSIETRVGPQLARISVQQSFPWPTKLEAAADAAAAEARAEQRRFEAMALNLRRRVAESYWQLWQLRRVRRIHEEHALVLRGLSETVGARLETGSATLAEQQQIDLSVVRVHDAVEAMTAQEQRLQARLAAELGMRSPGELPTSAAAPAAGAPAQSDAELRQRALKHPLIESFTWVANAQQAAARREQADAYPRFTLGADWIITGEASTPNMPESGKDAVIVGGGMTLPLWQGSYDDSSAAAEAEARAARAKGRSLQDLAVAQLEAALTSVREAARRASLFETTLVPQAEAAYASVLGAYVGGRASVAATLLAQKDLLELRIEQERLRAEFAIGWAELEDVVGGTVPVARQRPTPAKAQDELAPTAAGNEPAPAETIHEPSTGEKGDAR